MPLVRYEVRCEHSLANPELYRTADRDDSEGLLEGVAMAGLVGIVRQLGDMAEFASEIFQDLHDDIMMIVSRGQNLKARVARLEADLPGVEKKLLMEASQLTFAYSTRSKWRASLPMDQNLCAQGDVPRFVRDFYDDCRGPPRLFLLDKFDEAGRGACVKRYTDPTFFKINWVSSQLVKAEQLQRQREAELQKKNSAAEGCSNNDGAKTYTRERLSSALFENLEGFTGDFTPDLRSRRLDRVLEIPIEGVLTPDEPGSPEEPRSPEHRFQRRQLPEVAEGPVLAPLKINARDIENGALGRRVSRSNDDDGLSCDEEDASNDDFYVDALTTMESDVDSEPGSRTRWDAEVQSRFAMEFEHEKSLNQSMLKSQVEAHRQTSSGGSDELDHNDDDTCKVGGFKEPDSLVVGNNTVREWGDSAESLAGSPGDQPSVEDEESLSVDESIANESVTSEESDARNGHEYVAEKVHEESLLPSTLPDVPPNPLPHKPPVKLDKDLDEKLDGKHDGKLTEKFPNDIPDNLPNELPEVCPNKLPDTAPYKSPNKVAKKVSKITPKKALGKPSLQSHASVSLLDVRRTSTNVKEKVRTSVEGRNQSPGLENQVPQTVKEDQSVLANVGQLVTPRSRRRWAKDNGSQIQTTNILGFADTERRNLSLRVNDSLDLNNLLRSRMLGGSGHFQEEVASGSQRAVIIHEDQSIDVSERLGYESTQHRPHRNDSSSSVIGYDDGWYMSSASSSPKGPNICALSPPESPARVARGLMGSPVAYSTDLQFDRKSPEGPPVIPFLSISPTVSRSPSLNQDLSLSKGDQLPHNYPFFGRALQPTPPPQLGATLPSSWSPQTTASSAHNSDQLKDVPATDPRRAIANGGLHFEKSRIQASTLPNPAPRSRTWVDRSESNVAATLRAIRQASAVVSDQDDDTGSEC